MGISLLTGMSMTSRKEMLLEATVTVLQLHEGPKQTHTTSFYHPVAFSQHLKRRDILTREGFQNIRSEESEGLLVNRPPTQALCTCRTRP